MKEIFSPRRMSRRFSTKFARKLTWRPCSGGSILSAIGQRCRNRCGISPIFILISSSALIEGNKAMANTKYNLIEIETGVPIKAWTKGVKLEDEAKKQLLNVARLPFVYKWVAAMPDVHWGIGATVGSVIPTKGAIIPAAVGVDIGCGMMAVQTTLSANQLPDNLRALRTAIERAIPHGRTHGGGKGDKGAWREIPLRQIGVWRQLQRGYKAIIDKYPKLDRGNDVNHLGTLGTGNHFIEVCLDENNQLWFMLHSGSRGVGEGLGSAFLELTENDMREHIKNLPDKDLAYFKEGSEHFEDYVDAVSWAQEFAMYNRKLMMEQLVDAVSESGEVPPFSLTETAVNCHHNYVAREKHYGAQVFVTRKGAVRAGKADMGIIPGSMGARSYIVRGLGNPESFESCSHGAGRTMSRNEARKRFTVDQHVAATAGVECRKDAGVIDATPAAYQDIDAVMEAQRHL